MLLYGDLRSDGLQYVHVRRSRDRGRTWADGGVIPAAFGTEQQFGRIATAPNGREIVLFYEVLPAGQLRASSSLSTDDGATWSTPVPLATQWSNGHDPRYAAAFIGDYLAIAVGRDGVAHPVWTDLREVRGIATQAIWTREVKP